MWVCVVLVKIVDWNIDGVVDNNQAKKKRRILAIAEVLKQKQRVSYKLFLAEMQINGIRFSVAEGYLKALVDKGVIGVEKGEIIWNDKD